MQDNNMEEWVERYRLPIVFALVAITLGGVAAFLVNRPATRPIELSVATQTPRPSAEGRGAATEGSRPVSKDIKVYVTGEVAGPGVYTLADGDRVEDALQAAGGATQNADLIKINLAMRVRDQMQIHVPAKGESAPAGSPAISSGPSARININIATAAELDSLSGIGPATAQRIITYRQQNGPFKRVEDLKDAKLVNGSTFEKIKDLITVD